MEGYDYKKQKQELFSEHGLTRYVKVRDNVYMLLHESGAVRMSEAIGTGDTWQGLACVELMVEIGELKEITRNGTFTQHRVFVIP